MISLLADDTVLLAESKMLQRVKEAFDLVCNRRKLKVNAKKMVVLKGLKGRWVILCTS